jgi:hypothetical protein
MVCAVVVVGEPATQTRITADKNKYTPAQDVQIGKEAAAEVRKQLPLLDDGRVEDWVERVGARLVSAIPAEFAHPEFRYTFEVVNQKEINAFALPGGPMFLNRGMIEAGKVEAEVAGVMAHEISHVALRHGTAQATKGQKFQLGALLGQVAGAVVGGTAGQVIAQGSQFTLGTYFLKYGREYERQADLLGAHILARAGYDPRQMANMFKTIEAEGGGSGPEWLSSHPNPGNRYEAINREAGALRVQGNANTGQFQEVQARLRSMPPAYTAEQIAKGQAKSNPPQSSTTSARTSVNVPPPSSQYRTSSPFPFLRMNLPSNWSEVSGGDTGITYAPEGGYRASSGQLEGVTHGFQVGVTSKGSGNLQRDTDQLVSSFAQSNPQLRRQEGYSRETIGGRAGVRTTLTNQSDITGQPEVISLATTKLNDGRVLFLVGVAPQRDAGTYNDVFKRVRQSLQLSDR